MSSASVTAVYQPAIENKVLPPSISVEKFNRYITTLAENKEMSLEEFDSFIDSPPSEERMIAFVKARGLSPVRFYESVYKDGCVEKFTRKTRCYDEDPWILRFLLPCVFEKRSVIGIRGSHSDKYGENIYYFTTHEVLDDYYGPINFRYGLVSYEDMMKAAETNQPVRTEGPRVDNNGFIDPGRFEVLTVCGNTSIAFFYKRELLLIQNLRAGEIFTINDEIIESHLVKR